MSSLQINPSSFKNCAAGLPPAAAIIAWTDLACCSIALACCCLCRRSCFAATAFAAAVADKARRKGRERAACLASSFAVLDLHNLHCLQSSSERCMPRPGTLSHPSSCLARLPGQSPRSLAPDCVDCASTGTVIILLWPLSLSSDGVSMGDREFGEGVVTMTALATVLLPAAVAVTQPQRTSLQQHLPSAFHSLQIPAGLPPPLPQPSTQVSSSSHPHAPEASELS